MGAGIMPEKAMFSGQGRGGPRLPGSSVKGQPELLRSLPSDSHAVWALG